MRGVVLFMAVLLAASAAAVSFDILLPAAWKTVSSALGYAATWGGLAQGQSSFMDASGGQRAALADAAWRTISDENAVQVFVRSLDLNGGNCAWKAVLENQVRDINATGQIVFDSFSAGNRFALKLSKQNAGLARCQIDMDLNVA